jgi:hypothetical protein
VEERVRFPDGRCKSSQGFLPTMAHCDGWDAQGHPIHDRQAPNSSSPSSSYLKTFPKSAQRATPESSSSSVFSSSSSSSSGDLDDPTYPRKPTEIYLPLVHYAHPSLVAATYGQSYVAPDELGPDDEANVSRIFPPPPTRTALRQRLLLFHIRQLMGLSPLDRRRGVRRQVGDPWADPQVVVPDPTSGRGSQGIHDQSEEGRRFNQNPRGERAPG